MFRMKTATVAQVFDVSEKDDLMSDEGDFACSWLPQVYHIAVQEIWDHHIV